jgi:glycosyltransferase involved in cell wall biosynthesis
MKVGVLSASISRQAGGFFSSVRFLSAAMSREGCDVSVFGVEDEFAEEDAAEWTDVRLRLHARQGPAAFGYAPELAASVDAAKLDILHAHGLWKYPSVAASRWASRSGKPLIVSPRGMLDPWALANSRWKKRIAWALYERANLAHAACLHALNEAEHDAIRACGLTNPVAVIPNGVDLPKPGKPPPRPKWAAELDGTRVLLFLGRLHPKKGLASLLRAWARVNRQAGTAADRWCLVIAGWDQGGHELELRQLTKSLSLGEAVRFAGPQFGEDKAASFAFADGFVLPSQSEGLPLAVLEGWAYGLPVVMTAQCNLPEGFAAGAAMEISSDADHMAEGLSAFLSLPEAKRLAMGERGRHLVDMQFAWDDVAHRMAEVYRWLIDGGERPASVRLT